MARKRGGIAGIYDRNKGLIRTGATIGATLLGGPMAGAATGAAFRGLDREGKSGIGFDVGQGIRGGLEGYAIGQGTQGVQNLLTGAGKAAGAVAPKPFDFSGTGIGATPGGQPPVGPFNFGGSPVANLPGLTDASGNAIKQGGGKIAALLKGARENKDLIAMAGKGAMQFMPQPGEDAAMMRAETERMSFEEQRKRDEERRLALQQYFMPMIQQMQRNRQSYSG